MKKWCSIDPANRSGIAYWEGGSLIETAVLRKVGSKGRYSLDRAGLDSLRYNDRWGAFYSAILCNTAVVVEEGCGRFTTAVKAQASIRGYIEAVCHCQTDRGLPVSFITINVTEWRRVIKEEFNISWPATTERKKALSVSLVRQRFGIDVSDDEADAVLLGLAALRMRVVEAD